MNLPVPLSCRKLTSLFTIASTTLLLMLVVAARPANAQTSGDASQADTSAAASSSGDWTQFLNNSMQRSNPYEKVLGVNNAGSLQLKWTQMNSLPYIDYGDLVVANGIAYFGGGENEDFLYAVDASTGQLLWKYALKDGVASTPAVANGVVYFTTFFGGVVYALNAKTGAYLWSLSVVNDVNYLTVADGVVYVGGGDAGAGNQSGALYALDAGTGAVLWNYTGVVVYTPAVANGVAYFGVLGPFDSSGNAIENHVLALNAHTGAVLWDYFIGGAPATNPTSATVVANGVVYFTAAPDASQTYNLYAVNASTGKTLWVYNGVGGTPAVADGVVFVSSARNLYALNATTGKQLWSNQVTHTEFLTTPAVANGVVYISGGVDTPTTSGHMYALNASTGATLWSYSLPNSDPNSPIVSNGTVYVTDSHTYPAQNISYLHAFSIGADLFLRAMPSATTVHPGDLLTYTLPVWNLGPANAVQEVLNTQVPPGTTFDYVRVSGTPGLGTCTTPPYGGTGQIVCHQNGSMAPNTTWTVRLTVKVTAPSGTTITENAATMADTLDPNLANNTATVSVKVQ